MSIQFRLNALIGLLLAAALAWIIATMIYEAAPRVGAESASIMRLSTGFVSNAVAALKDSKDPVAGLKGLVEGLKDVRHIRVGLEGVAGEPGAAVSPPPEPRRSWLKARLARLVHLEASVARIPVEVGGRPIGTVVVASQPDDEIDEVIDDIVDVAWRGLLLAAAVFALTSLVINRALNPIGRLGRAMADMQAGDFAIKLEETGPPEIAGMSRKLNDLAGALEQTRSQNRWLSQKVIRVADDERRDLARELHDELGPYLFAVRAGATSMKQEIVAASPDRAKLSAACATLLDQIDAIQRTNRRVLHKLRPVGLSELGLAKTLEGLVALWRADHPAVDVTLEVSGETERLDDTSALTIYRVVQEGMTNAFRHAEASRIAVVVAPAGDARPAMRITVSDNGRGLAEAMRRGFGITGMSERVWALGGTVTVSNAVGGGVLLEAVVPVEMNGGPARG